jgi:hypothetical protein
MGLRPAVGVQDVGADGHRSEREMVDPLLGLPGPVFIARIVERAAFEDVELVIGVSSDRVEQREG